MVIQKFDLVMEKTKDYNSFKQLSIVDNPQAVLQIAQGFGLDMQAEEVFAILGLDVQNKPTSYFEVHRGALSESIVSPREIFKRLFLANAYSFIALHNHPSGLAAPSPADKELTSSLSKIAKALQLQMLDHIIVGDDSYYSFSENGKL